MTRGNKLLNICLITNTNCIIILRCGYNYIVFLVQIIALVAGSTSSCRSYPSHSISEWSENQEFGCQVQGLTHLSDNIQQAGKWLQRRICFPKTVIWFLCHCGTPLSSPDATYTALFYFVICKYVPCSKVRAILLHLPVLSLIFKAGLFAK